MQQLMLKEATWLTILILYTLFGFVVYNVEHCGDEQHAANCCNKHAPEPVGCAIPQILNVAGRMHERHHCQHGEEFQDSISGDNTNNDVHTDDPDNHPQAIDRNSPECS